ncbi:unnamed protein product [Sphagnum troendelagicum]|uniref:Uncharacterized protein n=1 Tax=Sphagnum troendelagicum TaxID=128251 RepID=A0ABP0UXU2_9BRYO
MWQGPHRLYAPFGPALLGGAKALGFSDADSGGFEDVAPHDRAHPSAMCTVIAVDFSNGIYEELFFNNIGDNNRLLKGRTWKLGMSKNPKVLEQVLQWPILMEMAVLSSSSRSHVELHTQPLSFYHPLEISNAWISCQATHLGAPARGASVKLFDENGHIQKCVIDTGRYGPLDKCSL